MWSPFRKSKRKVEGDGAEGKKKKRRKGDGECEAEELEDGPDGEGEFPDEYEQGSLIVKDCNRAQQLHRHDEESREVLCDMDKQIDRLRKLRQRATRKLKIKPCPEPEGEET